MGFINPSVYSIGAGTSYTNNFHDIEIGGNGAYGAGEGYDLVTGWGSPVAGCTLIDSLANVANNFSLTASPASETIFVGSAGSSNVLVTNYADCVSGLVTFTAVSPTVGITPAFSPATSSTGSTVTFTVGTGVAPGDYTATVKGSLGAISSSTTVRIVVVPNGNTPATATFSVTGSNNIPTQSPGTIALTINGVVYNVAYSRGATAGTVASALATSLRNSGLFNVGSLGESTQGSNITWTIPVTTIGRGTTVNYAFTFTGSGSFAVAPTSGHMSGGS